MGQKYKPRQARNFKRWSDEDLHSVLKFKSKRTNSKKAAGIESADPVEFWSDPCWSDPL